MFPLSPVSLSPNLLLVSIGVLLVCLGCYNKMLQTKWIINNRHFSQFWRLGSLGSRCWHIWCLVKALSLVHRQLSFHCVLTWRTKGQGSSLGSLQKGTNTIHEGSTRDLVTSRGSHLQQVPSLWRLGFNMVIWRGHNHSVCGLIDLPILDVSCN